jgi:ABC-type transporter Mla subunit MlaD
MQIHKNEITTGILVLGTLLILIAALVYVAVPGVVKPLNTYLIYFDNANGIRPGNLVLLAGREIGKVTTLRSPVPPTERPAGHPEDEVSIEVQVDQSAGVYYNATVHLTQQGIMGQQIIDFVHGDESSQLATNHTVFVGERVPDVSEVIATDMKRLTGDGSDLAMTIKNLNHITGENSDLVTTINNAKSFVETLNNGKISQIIGNASQLSDTLKREPWRLAWPSTKTYPAKDSSHKK